MSNEQLFQALQDIEDAINAGDLDSALETIDAVRSLALSES